MELSLRFYTPNLKILLSLDFILLLNDKSWTISYENVPIIIIQKKYTYIRNSIYKMYILLGNSNNEDKCIYEKKIDFKPARVFEEFM